MTPERTGHKILIVATDAILGALVGTLVEHARYTAAYPAPGESASAALERLKPLAAVVLDLADDEGDSDLFISRAARLSVPIFVFGRQSIVDAHADRVKRQHLRAFALPEQIAELENAIEALIPDAVRPRAVRDRRGNAERRSDGTLDFTDPRGVHWTVFDRRGADRRNHVDRRFVSDTGEVRSCEITEQEARLVTVATLSDQLSRSTRE